MACEASGVVRDAFIARGHDAISCDLLPTAVPGPHYQGDVLDILGDGWDLMVAHPPCTFLSNSGVRWLTTDLTRWPKLIEGAVFFRELLQAPIPRVAVENPVMHHFASDIIGSRQTQTIQPWQFGHDASKRTGFWLRGLPELVPTDVLIKKQYANQTPSGQNKLGPSPQRAALRAVTYTGIAKGMAEQWG